MDLGLAGRVALVFGASGGLGEAVARALSSEGAAVALAGRNAEALARIRKELNPAVPSMVVPWDLAEIGRVDELVSSVERELGPVSILFNNTGGPPPGGAQGVAPDVWTRYFQAMVTSVIAVTDRVLPGMKQRGWGRIITSASSGVVIPLANLALSNSLRAALVGWSKTLAREVARDGVTVNVLVPGRIDTRRVRELDLARGKRENRPVADVQAESAASIPTGRYGDPAEFAAAAAFLASAQASYITGSQLRVDGGLIGSH